MLRKVDGAQAAPDALHEGVIDPTAEAGGLPSGFQP